MDKGFNASIFELMRHFALGSKELNKIWVKKNKVSIAESNIRSLEYVSPSDIFPEEFGLNDVSRFVSVLSMFKNPTLELDLPQIKVVDESSTRSMLYNTSSKPAFVPIIESITKASTLHKVCKSLESDGRMFEFVLTNEMINNFMKAGNILSAGTMTESMIHFTKNENSDELLIMITNDESESDNYTHKITGTGAEISKFDHKFKVKHLLSGNWIYNIFEKTIDIDGDVVDCEWCHSHDASRDLSMIHMYIDND